jgi:recombination protein RecR
MEILPHSVERLISEFSKLPSIGPKTAERLTFHLLRSGGEKQLGEAAAALREGLQYCSQCQNFSSGEICELCKDPRRDDDVWAVVSQPLDVVAVEKTGLFKGRYHVLHGVISPVDGIGPEQLRIAELMRRIEAHKPSEIILATNPNVEGETTALYLAKKLSH